MDSNNSDSGSSSPVSSTSLHSRIVTIILSSSGVLLNVTALVVIVVHKQLTSAYRVMLFSLTAIDLGFILTTLLLAVTSAWADSFGQTDVSQDVRENSSDEVNTTAPTTAHFSPTVKTTCLVLTAMFHSFLISAATTTLATSLDRAVAVHSPVLYRVLSNSKVKVAVEVSPSVIIVVTGVLTLPFLHQSSDVIVCVPVLLVDDVVLILQAIVLLVSAVGMALTYFSIAYKLTRRATLVFPFFSQRTSDDTPQERHHRRLSVMHAAVQATWFCIVYIVYATYVIWIAVSGVDRMAEAQTVRFAFISSLPLINSLTNPLLIYIRLLKVRAFLKHMHDEITHHPHADHDPAGRSLPAHRRHLHATLSSSVDRDLSDAGPSAAHEPQRDAHASPYVALHRFLHVQQDPGMSAADAAVNAVDDQGPSTPRADSCPKGSD